MVEDAGNGRKVTMKAVDIESVLNAVGEQLPSPARLVLIGGGALALLGSPRPTIDLDFIGDDLSPSKLHQEVIRTAQELNIVADPVPLERFIPLPVGSQERHIHIGRFGNLDVHVADPYSIALSKLDRGFDTDLDDIVFLLRRRFIELDELERIAQISPGQARDFDMDPAQILSRLDAVRRRLEDGDGQRGARFGK